MPLASYNFRQGVDLPQWEWLPQHVVNNYYGCSLCYDGTRFIYVVAQSGSNSTSASTTTLYRFDTVTGGWQFMVNLTSGNRGIDVDYDPVRNVLWIIHGAGLTEWRYYNLNLTSITLCGQVTTAMTLSAAIGTVLPANCEYSASIIVPDDLSLIDPIDTGIAATGSTSTLLIDNTTDPSFQALLPGLYLEYTSGALSGQRRVIASVGSSTQLTTTAFTGAPAAGDAWKIVLPKETASSATTTTIVKTGAGWTVNQYANHDVEILSGTGAGQRRRIASNDATTLTLAGAVAGATRTGPWGTTPDATSVFVIKPSSDFVYYQPGTTSAVLYRMDITATTLAWTTLASMPAAPGGGGDLKHAAGISPFGLVQVRGSNTNTYYYYNIGLNTWGTFTSIGVNGETNDQGVATVNLPGRRRILIFRVNTQRSNIFNVATGELQPGPFYPYAAWGAYDGKRAVYVKTPDGVEWVYLLRASSQDFMRVCLEWF